ncbi:ComF family protein [Craterilacuibacter sinensis]|uniref:ComF family protein n=1 Tax=Craterilacuibacter sinensis TaxID=2686017 RepID=UPI002E2AC6D2|nr:ComF family protein [Craterilacuibacter sinensis]
MPSNFIRHIVDNCLPFKQICLFCAAAGTRHGVCAACLADLVRLPAEVCPRCAQASPFAQICGRCLRQPPAFDVLHAALLYDYPLDGVIQAFKYGKRLDLAGSLAFLLAELAPPAIVQPDLVVAVPLADARRMERGFNQSLELARAFAGRINAPLNSTLCERIRNTPPQARLNQRQRRHNVSHAFRVKHRVDGLCVAIVDDVATSGATLSELALSLKKQGAKRVEAWVLARVFYSKT